MTCLLIVFRDVYVFSILLLALFQCIRLWWNSHTNKALLNVNVLVCYLSLSVSLCLSICIISIPPIPVCPWRPCCYSAKGFDMCHIHAIFEGTQGQLRGWQLHTNQQIEAKWMNCEQIKGPSVQKMPGCFVTKMNVSIFQEFCIFCPYLIQSSTIWHITRPVCITSFLFLSYHPSLSLSTLLLRSLPWFGFSISFTQSWTLIRIVSFLSLSMCLVL